VTNDAVVSSENFLERAIEVAHAGEVAIHLRTTRPAAWLKSAYEHILSAVPFATVYFNDRLDIAMALNAPGVHLPEMGLDFTRAIDLAGNEMVVGRSCHTLENVRASLSGGCDYVFLGPVWSTASHPDQMTLGPGVLEGAGSAVMAIGGINSERAPEAISHGACGVAVISAVWNSANPGRTAEDLLLSLDS